MKGEVNMVSLSDYDIRRLAKGIVKEMAGNDRILDNILRIRAARLAVALKRYDEAESYLRAAGDDAVKGVVTEIRGDIAAAKGQKQEAVKLYREALDLVKEGFEKPGLKMKYENLLSDKGVKPAPEFAASAGSEAAVSDNSASSGSAAEPSETANTQDAAETSAEGARGGDWEIMEL